jgi:hypothetical protein
MMGIVTGVGGSSGGSFNANVAAGDSTADGIKKALAGGSLVLVKRGSEVPSDAVEVVLK